MDYKYKLGQKDKIQMATSPRFDNQPPLHGYSQNLFPGQGAPIDSQLFMHEDHNNIHNYGASHGNRISGVDRLQGHMGEYGTQNDQGFMLSQPGLGMPTFDSYPIHNDHHLLNQSMFGGTQDQLRQSQQNYYQNPTNQNTQNQLLNQNANNQRGNPSGDLTFANINHNASVNYENSHRSNRNNSLKGQFSDFSWRSDDDEDYSLNEDLELNQKIYKKDLRPFKFQIPKTEVNDLLRDTIKNNNNSSIDSILDISGPSASGLGNMSSNVQYNQGGMFKKRRFNERITPLSSGNNCGGMMNSNQNNQLLQSKRQRIGGINMPPMPYQHQHRQDDFNQNSNIDQMFGGGFDSQPPLALSQFGQQQQSQSLFRPNLQNNYYYNFNNNYGGPDNCGSQVQLANHQMKPNVQTKSIEIQVTPEKLVENEESYQGKGGDKDSKLKKRRRRQRKSKNDNGNAKNGSYMDKNMNGDNKQAEYLQYYEQYALLYGNTQPYNLSSTRFPSNMPQSAAHYNPYQNPYMGMMGMPPTMNPLYYQNIPTVNPFGLSSMQQQNQSSSVANSITLTNDDQKFKEHIRDYLRTMFYPFQNDQLKELSSQIDIYIQILYQMLLLTKKKQGTIMSAFQQKSVSMANDPNSKESIANDKLRYRIYTLLYDFQSKKEQTLKPFNLPVYQVPFITTNKGESLKMNPQVSYFQSPLLEIAPDIIQQLSKSNQDSKTQMKFLNSYTPLINQYLLPSIYNFLPKGCLSHNNYSNHPFFKQMHKKLEFSLDGQPIPAPGPNQIHNNRRKFSYVDDNFLLLGLRQYGYKEVEQIRDNWLPNKTTNEIKHRYKNLTCAKAPDNIIKRWKVTHNIPLNDNEEKLLAKAVKWFGANTNRWVLISKCFLPNRSPQFLKMEYQNIVADHSRAEKFGQHMLSEGDEEDKNFEDIDLDQLDNNNRKRKNSSSSQGINKSLYSENELADKDLANDDEQFEELDFDINKAKNRRDIQLQDEDSQMDEDEIDDDQSMESQNDLGDLNNLQHLLANFMGSKNLDKSKKTTLKHAIQSLKQTEQFSQSNNTRDRTKISNVNNVLFKGNKQTQNDLADFTEGVMDVGMYMDFTQQSKNNDITDEFYLINQNNNEDTQQYDIIEL
eukprot:403365884